MRRIRLAVACWLLPLAVACSSTSNPPSDTALAGDDVPDPGSRDIPADLGHADVADAATDVAGDPGPSDAPIDLPPEALVDTPFEVPTDVAVDAPAGEDVAAPPPCAPGANCTVAAPECLGFVDQGGETRLGFRVSELTLSKPAALATGILKAVAQNAIAPDLQSCNVPGSGTLSWLVLVDLAGNTIRTGGAKPVADPTDGYAFVDEVVQGLPVRPYQTGLVQRDGGATGFAEPGDVVVPVYLNAFATQVLPVPLHRLDLSMVVSASRNCVGTYNAAGLDPANLCLPDDSHPAFLPGGTMTALMTLEDADTVVVDALQKSLCVLVTGDPGTSTRSGVTVCRRDAGGGIVAQGDACSTGADCLDAVTIEATFAASSVAIR